MLYEVITRLEKLDALVKKTNRAEEKKELELMRRVLAHLEQETPLRNVELADDEKKLLV